MKQVAGILLIALLSFSTSAQEDKSNAILKELSTKAKTFKSVKANFMMTYTAKGGSKSTSKGNVAIKGQKFKLITGEGQDIYSDGKTVWTYVKDDQIVYKCPKEEALEGSDISDPSELFTIWEKDFKSRYLKEETIGDKNFHVIRLHPTNPTKVKFHTITLKINQKTKEVEYFIIKSKDGSTTTYKISSFVTNSELSDSLFKWSNKPGVDVEDC